MPRYACAKCKEECDETCESCNSSEHVIMVKYSFDHKCIQCDTEWTTKSRLNSIKCRSCSAKDNIKKAIQANYKDEKDKVRYFVTCPDCNKTRQLSQKPKHRKTDLCGTCSRKATGLKNKVKTEPYERVCSGCGKIDILKRKTEFDKCASCRQKGNKYNLGKKYIVKQKKKVSEDKKIKKLREKSRNHRESVKREKKNKVVVPQASDEQQRQWINEFYKKNKVVCVEAKQDWGVTDCVMRIEGY